MAGQFMLIIEFKMHSDWTTYVPATIGKNSSEHIQSTGIWLVLSLYWASTELALS